MFLAGALAMQGLFDASVVLPPLDRAVTLLSVICIVWLWTFPEPSRNADAGAILFSLIAVVTLVFSLLLRTQDEANIPFNDTVQYIIWTVLTLAIVIFGIVMLVSRKPNLWSNGLAMLLLIGIGLLLDLLAPIEGGNYAGASRLFLMAAFPILLTLPQRYPTPAGPALRRPVPTNQIGKEEMDKDGQTIRERRRYSTDAKTLHALLDLASEVESNKLNDHITRAVAQSMLADLTFLIYVTESKQLVVASGYDLIREEKLDGTPINNERVPLLANAVIR
jgi:FtsH-binding integral membrane protein